jgi:hypothetical protein
VSILYSTLAFQDSNYVLCYVEFSYMTVALEVYKLF